MTSSIIRHHRLFKGIHTPPSHLFSQQVFLKAFKNLNTVFCARATSATPESDPSLGRLQSYQAEHPFYHRDIRRDP